MHQPTGQGHVIAFAEDPNFRAFTEATELLFINAVLLGPGALAEFELSEHRHRGQLALGGGALPVVAAV